MRSLWMRLALAFIAVIAVSVGGVALLAGRETTNEFQSYVERGRFAYVERVLNGLVQYYHTRGTWAGVDAVLGALLRGPADHFVVADAAGTVVADTDGHAVGQDARALGLGPGTPIVVDGQRVGTLYATITMPTFWRGPRTYVVDSDRGEPVLRGVDRAAEADANAAERAPRGPRPAPSAAESAAPAGSPAERGDPRARRGPPLVEGPLPGASIARPSPTTNSPEASFMDRVGRALMLSAVAAAVLAGLLSLLLARQLAQPLRELAAGARALAAGNLAQRVRVRSRDEVGELAVAFNDMAASLERAETARRNLVADVAHELRTPLTVIEGTVDAMLDGVYPADRDRLESIREETRLLAKLVADLRELSLADVGGLRLEREPQEPAALVRRAVAGASGRARQRRVELVAAVEDALPPVVADEQRIVQVLANLLDNALRYTPAGGRVVVSAERAVRGRSPLDPSEAGTDDGVSAASAGEPAASGLTQAPGLVGVRFAVRDSGPGIAAADLPHIFERFYRADPSRSRRSGGSGLGLAIARGYVEAHGGLIWAMSAPGEGTIVAFWLPAAPGAVATTEPLAPAPALAQA